MNRIAVSAICLLATVALGGCAWEHPEGTEEGVSETPLTLERAKAQTIALGEEVASHFPTGPVLGRRTMRLATLLPCAGEDRYGWPGRTTLRIAPVADQAEALAPIAAEWERRLGWRVERSTTTRGAAALDLHGPDGTRVSVSFYRAGTEVWVDVVSPCFRLPGGSRGGVPH